MPELCSETACAPCASKRASRGRFPLLTAGLTRDGVLEPWLNQTTCAAQVLITQTGGFRNCFLCETSGSSGSGS